MGFFLIISYESNFTFLKSIFSLTECAKFKVNSIKVTFKELKVSNFLRNYNADGHLKVKLILSRHSIIINRTI